jgi:hypothetical protein
MHVHYLTAVNTPRGKVPLINMPHTTSTTPNVHQIKILEVDKWSYIPDSTFSLRHQLRDLSELSVWG